MCGPHGTLLCSACGQAGPAAAGRAGWPLDRASLGAGRGHRRGGGPTRDLMGGPLREERGPVPPDDTLTAGTGRFLRPQVRAPAGHPQGLISSEFQS